MTNIQEIVLIFKERKHRGIINNDSFFDYADLSQKKYFTKGFDYVYDYVDKLEIDANKKGNDFQCLFCFKQYNIITKTKHMIAASV